MTLNQRDLKKLGESMWVWFTKEQERIILDRFGTEPEPYEWSEQDVVEQIRGICREHPAPKPKDPPWATNTAAVNGKSSVGQPEVQHRATENTASGNPKAQRTQLKISVAPELASSFKATCAASNVSMAETLSGFIAKYTNTVVRHKPEYTTRRQRRTALKAMARQLERIKDAEEQYRDAIPMNLQGSVVFDNADQSVLLLDKAIDLLGSIY